MDRWETGALGFILVFGMYGIYDALRSIKKQLAIISRQLESLIKIKRGRDLLENEDE